MTVRAEVLRILDKAEDDGLSGQVTIEYRRGDAVAAKITESHRFEGQHAPMECIETKANGQH